jgi:transposase
LAPLSSPHRAHAAQAICEMLDQVAHFACDTAREQLDLSGIFSDPRPPSSWWAIVEPIIPPAKHGGRKRTIDVREILNGIFYVLSTGCQWQAVPKDLPPKRTVWAYFDLWSWDGTLERIHHALYVQCREQEEREASPTAAIIDSQSVKSAEKGGRMMRMATTRERRSRARSAIFS